MKNVGFEIDKIITEKKLKQKDIAEQLNMSAVNLSKILRKDSIDAELLERISNVLGINVGFFFGDDEKKNVSTTNSPGKCERCEHLEELLKSRESEIETLKKLVNMYEGDAGRREAKAC